jgi:hypothetical protein
VIDLRRVMPRTHAQRAAQRANRAPGEPVPVHAVTQHLPGALLDLDGVDQAPSPNRHDDTRAAVLRLADTMGWDL